ncbi:MAG: hypothetical protein R3280_05205 [Marinobacter sp.]|uniref:hypothetical protein n=1 Tax=Marinobacter sp. TaxID=50741 RepID=UPI00299EE7EF|nr:hypothetical protein [Marinobacter sp.]MDX1634009.1 hypothetical protein [Marinobacter sp.]
MCVHRSSLYGVVLAMLWLAGLGPAQAETLLDGQRDVILVDAAGAEFPIGTITFSPASDGLTAYQLDVDYRRFKDFFLSMKEMKCLEGREIWCHIPYPYQNPRTVSATDLRWLEHDLLFMFKRVGEFGANFWNGMYYRLSLQDGEILGLAHAVDLNQLAAPPEDLTVPPFGEFDVAETSLDERWLPGLVIR